ncbi:MAG: TfoX/Sxy family protein [Clostridiales bacterium]|nr:TfoX/Sxy family protein [Clostridiales bacterium]
MGELMKLENIGKECEKRLAAVGIKDVETLMKLGSKETFFRLYAYEHDTCLNTLCALEGAIEGIRWHYLSDETKNDLKKFYKEITK